MTGQAPTIMNHRIEYRRLRTPAEDGQALIDPELAAVGDLLATNRNRQPTYRSDLNGRSLCDLASTAREELVRKALHYTAQYRDVELGSSGSLQNLLLAGHQPHLFHPGVWFKNLALDRLATEHQAIGINLLIDSDTIKTASIRVPTGSVQQPEVKTVSFDSGSEEVPFEQRRILNRETFASFGERTKKAISSLVPDPIIEQLWPLATERMKSGVLLGECLAQSRHQLEGQWGLNTLEIPQSQICDLEAFHWFAAHLIAQLPRFWEVHNRALCDYRRIHHIRSHSHPVPDLQEEDCWLEAPFWVWTQQAPHRRRLFAKAVGEEILLTDRAGWECLLDLSSEGSADKAVEQLMALEVRGVKLRTRALATTMFARMLLSDVFMHGIGGSKYDQLTDQIIAGFFGIEPPEYMTLSATLRLPISRPVVTLDAARKITQQLRSLTYHPEKFLDNEVISDAKEQVQVMQHVAAKKRWIETPKTPQNAHLRHLEITRANEALQPWLESTRQELAEQRLQLGTQLRAEAIFASREYAFCLYPKETLQKLILALIATTS